MVLINQNDHRPMNGVIARNHLLATFEATDHRDHLLTDAMAIVKDHRREATGENALPIHRKVVKVIDHRGHLVEKETTAIWFMRFTC